MSAQEGDRLQKVLAHAGVGSRRAVEDLIRGGRVKVNGRRAELGRRVDPAKDQVEVDGFVVPLRAELVYLLVNKPEGVITSVNDPQGRPTVLDLLDVGERVWPVGRLDIASEGALIVTNDGDLTHHLTHPRYEVSKNYLVEVKGNVAPRTAKQLARGVELEDGLTAPAEVVVLQTQPHVSLLEIAIAEGRNRQVRRMCEAVGHPVRRLVRTAIGPVQLGRLKPGTVRKLTPDEVRSLYRAAGITAGD